MVRIDVRGLFRVPEQQRHLVPGMGQQMGQSRAPASCPNYTYFAHKLLPLFPKKNFVFISMYQTNNILSMPPICQKH